MRYDLKNTHVADNIQRGIAGWQKIGRGLSWSVRRRIMQALRASVRVLGMRRKHRGLGPVHPGTDAGRPIAGAAMASVGLALLLATVSTPALAGTCVQGAVVGDTQVNNGTAPVNCSDTSVAIGGGNGANASNNSVAIGDEATASGTDSTAVGSDSIATGNQATAIGTRAGARAVSSIAIGNNAVASAAALNGIAMGLNANVQGLNSIAIGAGSTVSGPHSLSVGTGNVISGADSGAFGGRAQAGVAGNNISGGGSFAVGNGNNITSNNSFAMSNGATVTGQRAVALGVNTRVSSGDAVALGSQSVANTPGGIAGYDPRTGIASTSNSTTWRSYLGAVSLGGINPLDPGVTATRQITNLAAGTQDNDAVNVAQLKAAMARYFSVNTTDVGPGSNYANNGATGANAIAIGKGASANGTGGTAVGADASATGNEALAFGAEAEANGTHAVAIGSQAQALNNNAIAIGRESDALGEYAIGIGSGAQARGNLGTAVGNNALARQGDTALGAGALDGSTSSGSTVAVGYGAGQGAGDVSRSTLVGAFAGASSQGTQNSFSGYFGGAAAAGNNNVAHGVAAGAAVTGDNNVSIGNQAGTLAQIDSNGNPVATLRSTYDRAVNIGQDTRALSDDAVAIGTAAEAAERAVAIGTDASALGRDGVAVGASATSGATGYNVAIGANGTSANANSTVEGAVAIGVSQSATGDGAVSLGSYNTANGDGSVAIGRASLATGDGSLALGDSVTATGRRAVALGTTSSAMAESGVALGNGATADSGDSAVAIGRIADASGAYAIAMGDSAKASADDALAFGSNAQSDGIGSIAIGTGSQVSGNQSIAIGIGHVIAGDRSGAFGDPTTITGNDSYAIGNDNVIDADQAFVLGNNVTIAAGTDRAVSLGHNSNVTVADGVALGAGSTADTVVGTSSVTINGTTYGFAGTAPLSTVSVGTAGAERTITNLAAGRVSATSTDAINGSQLHATNQAVAAAVQAANAGWNITAQGSNATNVGASSATGASVDFHSSDGNLVISKGAGSNDIDFALADDITLNSVKTGNTTVDTNGVSIAGGPNGTVSLSGSGLDNGGNRIINVAAGIAPTDVVNVSQLNSAIGTVNIGFAGNSGALVTRSSGQVLAIQGGGTTAGSYSGGNIRTVTDPGSGAINIEMAEAPKFGTVTVNDGGTGKITGVTGATLSSTSTEAVNGSQLVALGDSIAASLSPGSTYNPATNSITAQIVVGNNVYSNVQDALQAITVNGGGGGWTLASGANGSGVVTGDASASIAPGATATFVAGNNMTINQSGGALELALNPNLTGIQSITITGGPTINGNGIDMGGDRITNVGAGVAPTDAVNLGQMNAGLANTLGQANRYTDMAIADIRFDLTRYRRDANGGTAAAMAMSQVPQAFEPGMGIAGIGMSTWQGEQAIAFGFSKASDNGRVVVRATGSYNSRSEGGAAVGVGFQF